MLVLQCNSGQEGFGVPLHNADECGSDATPARSVPLVSARDGSALDAGQPLACHVTGEQKHPEDQNQRSGTGLDAA
jgi:hypothetical protein